MKKLGISLLFCLAVVIAILFSHFMTKETEKGITVEEIYAIAQENGYVGTLSDFINDFSTGSGNDGRGIASAEISSEGHLIITYTDGTSADLGEICADTINIFEEISGKALHSALTSSVSISVGMSDGKYSSGAGVIYKLDKARGEAYIITNYHVLYDPYLLGRAPDGRIFAYLYGMEYPMYKLKLKYVGGSSAYDVAVLKISGSDVIGSSGASAARVADSDTVSVLDFTLAVGNPLGMGISATEGRVSIESENMYINTGASGGDVFMRLIRTDAAINKGNSGGGLYNSDGSLIGIVCARNSDSGVDNVSYAIPSNIAASVAENIIYYCDGNAEEHGYIARLGIGLGVKSVSLVYDEILDKTVKSEVVTVKSVQKGSYADLAGLLVGDVLLSVMVDGRETPITRVHQAPEATISARAGSRVVYKVLREGTELEFTIICPAELTKIP